MMLKKSILRFFNSLYQWDKKNLWSLGNLKNILKIKKLSKIWKICCSTGKIGYFYSKNSMKVWWLIKRTRVRRVKIFSRVNFMKILWRVNIDLVCNFNISYFLHKEVYRDHRVFLRVDKLKRDRICLSCPIKWIVWSSKRSIFWGKFIKKSKKNLLKSNPFLKIFDLKFLR